MLQSDPDVPGAVRCQNAVQFRGLFEGYRHRFQLVIYDLQPDSIKPQTLNPKPSVSRVLVTACDVGPRRPWTSGSSSKDQGPELHGAFLGMLAF